MEDYIFWGKTQQLTFKAGRLEAKDQISRATASSQSLKHTRAKIIARLRLAMVFERSLIEYGVQQVNFNGKYLFNNFC